MVEWLAGWVVENRWNSALIAVGLFLTTFVVSLVVVAFLLIRLPADFFLQSRVRGAKSGRLSAAGWARRILKNLLGATLVGLGVLLSVPLIPGQGVLTILIGVMLLDFPGKRRLERAVVRRPRVLCTVNRLRARYGKPPLVLEAAERE